MVKIFIKNLLYVSIFTTFAMFKIMDVWTSSWIKIIKIWKQLK